MHLMITKSTTKKGIKNYAKIVHSYWNGKTSHQKILLNLGLIQSPNDLKKFNKILESMRKGEEFVKENDIKIIKTMEFGITYTTNKLLEKYGIDKILDEELSNNKAKFDIYEIIKALIINRLVLPSSELSSIEWINEDYLEEIDVKLHQIYRSLDYLIPKKEIIEKRILDNLQDKLKLDVSKTHYDLTSTYFEGKCCEIAFYGYSRDHRKDRQQVVIALVMCEGIPVYHEVYEGNTVDKATLKDMRVNLKQKLGIKETTIISDGGLITKDNLEDLEDNQQKYILGVPRRKNKTAEKYLTKKIESKENQSAEEIGIDNVKRNKKEYSRRYILCLDKNTRKERLETLKEIKRKKQKELKELQIKYEKSQTKKKGKEITKESMINQTYKILGKNKRLFDIEEKKGKLKIYFIEEAYEYEKNIAGKFLIVTNTSEKADKIMKAYKELQTVENAFDECKNYLYVRPIFHWKESRVRAHIFVCMLSFLIESIIERFSNDSARVTLRELERIRLTKIKIEKRNKNQITEISNKMSNIFKNLKIQSPTILDTKNLR